MMLSTSPTMAADFHSLISLPQFRPSWLNNALLPLLQNVVDGTHTSPSSVQGISYNSGLKNSSPLLAVLRSLPKAYSIGTVDAHVDVKEVSDPFYGFSFEATMDSTKDENLNNKIVVVEYSNSLDIKSMKCPKEKQRRKKIGLANKGKVPWNKGQKHSAETRKRIKQKTIEALRDPKIRKKMSEHPHLHCDEIKAKISSSLKCVWRKRLKKKQSDEKFLQSWKLKIANFSKKGGRAEEELEWDSYSKIKQQLLIEDRRFSAKKAKKKESATIRAKKIIQSWAESVAKAAKKGGTGEQELNWDSYDRIKQDIVLFYAAEEAKVKDSAKERARLAARIKAIKKEALTRKKNERVERMKSTQKEKKKISTCKSNNDKATLVEGTWNRQVPILGNVDLELIKKENSRKLVSLADQIRAARSKGQKSQRSKYSFA